MLFLCISDKVKTIGFQFTIQLGNEMTTLKVLDHNSERPDRNNRNVPIDTSSNQFEQHFKVMGAKSQEINF